jgi:hypothetical protein
MYISDKDKIKILVPLLLLNIVVRYCLGNNKKIAIEGGLEITEEMQAQFEDIDNKKAKLQLQVNSILNNFANDKLIRRAGRVAKSIGIDDWINNKYDKTQSAREFLILTKFLFEKIEIKDDAMRNEIEKIFDILLTLENKSDKSLTIKNGQIKIVKIGNKEFEKMIISCEKDADIFFKKLLDL